MSLRPDEVPHVEALSDELEGLWLLVGQKIERLEEIGRDKRTPLFARHYAYATARALTEAMEPLGTTQEKLLAALHPVKVAS